MKPLIIATLWISCGLAGAGFMNASMRPMRFDCERWAAKDQAFSIFLGAFGPITLIVGFVMSGAGYDGWTLARKPCA